MIPVLMVLTAAKPARIEWREETGSRLATRAMRNAQRFFLQGEQAERGGSVARFYARRRGGPRRFAPAALDAAAGFFARGSAAMLRLKASIRLTTFSREGATGSGAAGVLACFFLRIRASAFL
jgi:hypothetical protein